MARTIETSDWRAVNLSRYHDGQIVTPVVEYRVTRPAKGSVGRRYAVRYRMHDASGPIGEQFGESSVHRGDYWDCTRWLQGEGIRIEDTRGF